ncbi:MAG: protein kinase [Myxococcales bacterium]|nr:protein kinase [Myxococcales bacterium]
MTAGEPADGPARFESEWVGPRSDGVAVADEAGGEDVALDGPRYRLGGELGVGAMGRVRVAYDRLLAREVALKQVRQDGDAAAEAALLREARVTAGLDHPGIVAVLDAGIDPDGGRFYAMRVVHGQSLAEVAAAASARRNPTPLVRAVLQCAQAIAYAHARGVVHRDLSSRNVRVGAHGEVVVMDWGLAATVVEAARGGVCGTPGYRAPELARGEPAGPTADVWSLGALLHLVLVGGAPDAAAIPRRVPRELRSLLARALAPAPAERYPDAAALARDLSAFLDGTPLAAHRDRLWDRGARLARRHPAGLVAGAAGLVAVTTVAVVLGSLAERRATEARRSRAEARAALRTMVVARAFDAVVAERRDEALALAAQARELGAAAAAAGIEATFRAAPRMIVRRLADEDGCATLDVRADGARLCLAAGAIVLLDRGARTVLDLAPDEVTRARFLDAGGAVVIAAGSRGHHVVRYDRAFTVVGRYEAGGGPVTLDAVGRWVIAGNAGAYLAIDRDGRAREVQPCAPGDPVRLLAARSAGDGAPGAVAWCGDGSLALLGDDRVVRTLAPDLVRRMPAATAGVAVGDDLVIGSADGQVALVALPAGTIVRSGPAPVGAVVRLEATPDGDVIVVGADGVALWRPGLATWLHVAARDQATDATFVDGHVVAFGAGALVAWEPAAGGRIHRVIDDHGLASVAWSGDGRWVAFGGTGVHVVEPATGRRWQRVFAGQTVKSLAFAPDDQLLAVGIAGDGGLRLVEPATGVERPGPWQTASLRVRRLIYASIDRVVLFGYGHTVEAWAIEAQRTHDLMDTAEPVLDVATPRVGGPGYLLFTDGALARFDGDALQARRPAVGASAVALSGDGQVLALIDHDGAVELRSAADDGARGRLVTPGAAILDGALDRRGDRLALARLDGTLEIWDVRTRARRLVVRAHAGRAAAVAFAPDDCTLASAGWDGVGRLLALCAEPR